MQLENTIVMLSVTYRLLISSKGKTYFNNGETGGPHFKQTARLTVGQPGMVSLPAGCTVKCMMSTVNY